jgi:hypothetical protein
MKPAAIPLLYAVVLIATLWLALLWVIARARPGGIPRWLRAAAGVAALAAIFLPIEGVRFWSWVFGFCPNPSLLLLGVVGAGLLQRLAGIAVLKPADWTATWRFGALAGTVLYLHPMVLGAPDLYYWGWERGAAAWMLAGLAVAFLAAGNRLGALLVAALAGYATRALESNNAWDYALDPFFWLASLGVLAARAVRAIARKTPRPAQSSPARATP